MGPEPLPHLPLGRLRGARSDALRGLLARQPAWAHASPGRAQVVGDRGVTCHRLAADSLFVQVHWRWRDERWEERDCELVPGSVVALRLVLDDVAPQTVSSRLDLVPTRAFARGDSGPHARHVRDEGLWIHEMLPGAFCFAEEKVGELLALLRSRPRWREVVGQRGVRWAGVTVKVRGPVERPGGLQLDPRVLEDLVGLSLALDLEVSAE